MIYYIFLRLTDRARYETNNPFAEYEYGIGVSILVEIVLLIFSFWMSKLICYRINIDNKKLRTTLTPVVYAVLYPIVWACFWIENTAMACGLAVLGIGVISVTILIIIDLLVKARRN